VQEVITEMKEHHIPVLFAGNYYDRSQVEEVAARTGARAVIVAGNVGGAPGINTYFDLMNLWVAELARAFTGPGAATPQ
jgi:ABC-type Zn uptake system ZnuABC Zn-binding protein ZnuA